MIISPNIEFKNNTFYTDLIKRCYEYLVKYKETNNVYSRCVSNVSNIDILFLFFVMFSSENKDFMEFNLVDRVFFKVRICESIQLQTVLLIQFSSNKHKYRPR